MANAWELYKNQRRTKAPAENPWAGYKQSSGYKTPEKAGSSSLPLMLPTAQEKGGAQAGPSSVLSGADLAMSTLRNGPLLLPTGMEQKQEKTPTVFERIGSAGKSIGKTLQATPYVLGEALKADLDANVAAMHERNDVGGTFDVDPAAFGQSGNETVFDIDPDKVEQNPNAGVEKYQKPLDPNSKGMQLMGEAYKLREEATEGMSGAGKFLADAGISVASNALLLPTAAISPAIPLAAMGAQSAAQKTYEETKKGKSAGEALSRGIISGAIEAATEKVPLDTLADLVKTGGKSVLKNLLKQAGVEAGEEALSYTANFIADKAARDPDASFSVEELLTSAAAGGVSGLFFGIGGSAVNAVTKPKGLQTYEQAQQARKEQAGQGSAAVPEAKGLPTGREAAEGQKKTASTGEAGSNSRLSDADLQSYLTVGTREHVRNTKAEQLRNGQSPILTTVWQIRDFIKSAIEGKNRDTIKGYGKVGSRMAADIANKATFDVGDITGYYLELDSNHLDHLSDHINDDGDPRNIPLTEEQVLNLAEYIDSYDDVLDVVRKKDGSVKVHLGKRINGHTVIVEMLSKGRSSLHPVTAWQNSTEHYIKKYGKNKTQVDTSQPSAAANGESGYKPASSDPTVPHPEQGVKEEYARQGTENADPRAGLPTKAADYLGRAETALTKQLAKLMSVPEGKRREALKPILQKLSDHYLQNGELDAGTVDAIFEEAWEQGRVIDDEYVRQYGDIARDLRTRPVTLSEADRADFSDFNAFRKANMGRLNIRNEGGLPVDVLYSELSQKAPELFPAGVTHPADQLRRMSEAAGLIRKTEVALSQYYGEEAETYRKYDREEFGRELEKFRTELERVRAYSAEKTAEDLRKKDNLEFAAMDMSEEVVKTISGIWTEAKKLKRIVDKSVGRHLMTEADNKAVDRLLRGEITTEELPAGVNRRGVLEIYEAKKAHQDIMYYVRRFNKNRKAALQKEAESYLEGAELWKDKSAGLAYSRETMERNIRDIVTDPERAEAIVKRYIAPVHQHEAQRTRLKNEFRDKVRQLKLSRKVEAGNEVSEAFAVQWLGEAEDNMAYLRKHPYTKQRNGHTMEEWAAAKQDFLEANPNLNIGKVNGAIETFRDIYDQLFEMMNAARVRNGYEPVDYRQGYFPHFTADKTDGILSTFAHALGVEMEVTNLPTTINGLTHTFRPGTRWSGHIQRRTGFDTDYDALEGFDKYIESISDIICHTDDIQSLRALSDQIRYRASDDEIKARVDAVKANDSLDEIQKRELIEKTYQNSRHSLSNFVVELEEYTNLLAGKKSRRDRGVEGDVGRRVYNIVKALENRVAANMVAINPGSWLTNFIPLTQGGAELKSGSLLSGMWDTLKAYKENDGFADRSSFLTNRRGSDPLVRTRTQQLSAAAGKGMEIIDQFTADSLVRGRYKDNLSRGLSEQAAMEEADAWAASVMADRSKGALPTIFESKNPLYKLFTQFQVEVNNQLSYVTKDLPRNAKAAGGEWEKQLAATLLKFAVGAFLYDEVYEYFVGRRPALDPIGILNDTVGDLTGYELPNLVEAGVGLTQGELPSFRTEKKKASAAVAELGANVAEELPFVGGLLGGGRLPVANALPSLGTSAAAVANLVSGEGNAEKQKATLAKELAKPGYYLLPPFGGGQVKKIAEGAAALQKGGSYTMDSQGRDVLQYPVYTDNPLEVAEAVVFGKTTTPGGREWIESGFKNTNATQTAVYQKLIQNGVDRRTAYETVTSVGKAGNIEGEGQKLAQINKLQELGADPEVKSEVYYGIIASDKEKTFMDRMSSSGSDRSAIADALMELRQVKGTGEGQAERQRAALVQMDYLTGQEKSMLGQQILGDSRWMDYSSADALTVSQMSESGRKMAGQALRAGIDAGTFLDAYEAQKTAKEETGLLGKPIKLSKDRNKKAAIDAATPGLNDGQRRVLYEMFGVDKTVWGALGLAK